MARRQGALFAALLIAVASSSASAEDFVDPGGYLVIGGITAFEQFEDTGSTPVENSFGFEIRGGYRFMPYLAAEVGGDFLSGFEMKVDLPASNPDGGGTADLTIDGGLITANVLGYLPFGRIQPYGLVGLGGMWARLRSTYSVGTVCGPGYYWGWYCTGAYAELGNSGGFVMKFGGGTDFYITDEWAITIDATYVMPFGEIKELSFVNLGWGVRFRF